MRILTHRSIVDKPDRESGLAALPPHVRESLHAEGVQSLADWRRLGRKRRSLIFGVTRAMAKLIDAAAAREVWL